MKKTIIATAIVFVASAALADQKTPITPSLPAHEGTDIEGNKVIHNAPSQGRQPVENEDGASDGNAGHNKKGKK